jgi:NLR family CARD domain-containing protein 3
MSQARRYIHDEEELDLHLKDIGDEEAKQIAQELAINTTVTCLSLGCNKIGDDGAVALADALTKNKSLTRLELPTNPIGDIGMEALGRA